MNKNEILTSTITSMKGHLDELNLENFKDKMKIMNQFFDFIDSLNQIQMPQQVTEIKEYKDEKENAEEVNNNEEESTINYDILNKKVYRFERRLKGGELPEIGAFVPHRIIKELDLKHGDFLYAEPLNDGNRYDGPKRFKYELAYRGETDTLPQSFREFEKCKVEKIKEVNKFVVKETINNEAIFKNDGVSHPLFIDEKDMRSFGLEEGSIVDVAYYDNDPQGTFRVVWNYTIETPEEYKTPKPSGFYKRKDDSITEDQFIEENFEGKTVLVVGCEPKKAIYRDLIEKRGGEFLWASGKEDGNRLRAMVKNSDMVVFNLAHIGHRGTWRGIEYCKEFNVPHKNISSFGNTMFIETVEQMVNEENQVI